MTAPPGLHTLARLHGIQTAYHDHAGQRIGATPEALMAALRAMGVPVGRGADIPAALERRRRKLWERVLEPVVVAWLPDPAPFTLRLPESLGDARLRIQVTLEDGGQRVEEVDTLPPAQRDRGVVAGRGFAAFDVSLPRVPSGYHDLVVEVDAASGVRRHRALLLAAPRRCAGWEVLPGSPAWGVFAPLHALWTRRGPRRLADFGTLDRLAQAVASLGGSVVGTLPLLASFLDRPYDPSPYAPVSKLFWNELYVADVAEATGVAPVGDTIDPSDVAARRRRRLETDATAFFRTRASSESEPGSEGAGLRIPADLAPFIARNPEAPDYARFRALTERHGEWPGWHGRIRARDVRTGDYDPEVARYHLYAQWHAERQLAAAEERMAGAGVGLYLDLPLGVHPAGYDVWRHRSQFVLDATVGAPPDPLAPGGQDWGFHPPHPEATRFDGHRYFINAVRAHLRFARVLRIDHVMQLHRLFWVPEGDATDGVYVRYPHDELYAVLSLESHRAGSVIVGEDLGTVPRRVRRAMRRHGLPGTYVVQFSLREVETDEPGGALAPGRVPEGALAAIGTHDTPMFAAWWTGRDAEIRAERGLMEAPEAASQVEGRSDLRRKLRRGLGDDLAGWPAPDRGGPEEEDGPRAGSVPAAGSDDRDPSPARNNEESGLAAQAALYRVLGRSPAGLVLANLEDLWMETEPQNVPGTPAVDNWRRRAQRPVESVAEGDARRLLEALNDAREGTS